MEKDRSFISNLHIPRWEELPNIDLYLDQVVTLVNTSLEPLTNLNINSSREASTLTKTMINNYVKGNLIDAPYKKKYSKTQLAKLFVICILKQVYSINDIKNLITLALKTSPADISYNKFCNVLNDCLNSTFNGTVYYSDEVLSEEQYILKNVVQSFVNKLYVQIKYLKK